VSRLVPGVLPDPECFQNESHWDGLLEHPQYSRPAVWHDREVPAVLTSGNHAAVARWRRKQSILRTRLRRPDLYRQLDLSSREDQALLTELAREESSWPSGDSL
jgi:tRNA (guanine37-N1)-methyltransferase